MAVHSEPVVKKVNDCEGEWAGPIKLPRDVPDPAGPSDGEKWEVQYYDIAIQYYIAARSSAFANSIPVAANLFHLAVEMFLKFLLIHAFTADQLQEEFGHRLKKLWREAKRS